MLHRIELYGLGFDYPEKLPTLVGQVDVAAVLEAAQAVLRPESCAVAIAGPVASEPA